MRMALAEAARGVGRTHPNPAVGAVVVRSGKVVGRGFHAKAGSPHAEVMALADAGASAKGAELYVTLEPCDHFGRTPPCTKAILEAGVTRVVAGTGDPNPVVAGKGLAHLRSAGVEVETGVLEAECRALIRGFSKHVTSGLPFVTLKVATTLDGKLATRTGDSKWITGPAARERVHRWRDEHDAVLVGAGTVRADDPLLTTRLDVPAVPSRAPRTAVRVVIDGALGIDPGARILDASAGPTWVLTGEAKAEQSRAVAARGAEVIRVGDGGRFGLREALAVLGRRGITSVLVEGGAEIHGQLLESGLVDEVCVFIAPVVAGADGKSWAGFSGAAAMGAAMRLRTTSVERLGDDVLVTLTPAGGEPP